MQEDFAKLVYPVIAKTLAFKARLDSGEALDLNNVQADLRNELKTKNEAERWPDYGGDGDRWLGARYALTCWIDELFIKHSSWSSEWNNSKLEESVFQTRPERAWKFWTQAKLAQSRPGIDAIETFYLCVMLGFRGDGPDPPETLDGWKNAVDDQLKKGRAGSWKGPQELTPDLIAAPRHAKDRLQTIIVLILVVLAAFIPMSIIVLMSKFADK